MTTTTILVVDDELPIRRALIINLQARGYHVEAAATGAEALHLVAAQHPDLVLLDLGLPDIDGIDVIHGIRGWSAVPIVILSARGAESAKVTALDAGADDFVTKPFGIDELLARVRSALRRSQPVPSEPLVTTEHFTVDLARTVVTLASGTEVHLTKVEWTIVEELVRNADRLVTRRQLLERLWGPAGDSDTNVLRVHLTHIRKKLEPEPARPRYFVTETGMGYRFRTA